MSNGKTILVIIVTFVLASCGTRTPAATPTTIPTNTPQPTVTPTATIPPTPRDIPKYQNSFEGVIDLAASGITSNADITLNTETCNYPGGGTALEVSGTLPGAQYSSLYVDLPIRKLTGENSVDLTDKTIGYSAFIPADSAIDNISVYAGKGGQFLFLAGVDADDYWKKGAWHEYQFDLATVQGLMKDYDTIRIAGQRRLSEGTPTETSFLVDDLKWIRSDRFNLPVDDSIDSLRKYAANQHFEFGMFSADFLIFGTEDNPDWHGDPWYAYMDAQEGDVTTLEDIKPRPGEDYSNFNYDPVKDARVILEYQFDQAYHMHTYGYGMGAVYFAAPQWLRELSFPDASAFLLYHTEKSLQYTQGKQPVWNLFNEFIGGEGSGSYFLRNRVGYMYDYSPWAENQNDSSLIKAVFIKAREVDPGATLIVNDFYGEEIGLKKSEFLFHFVSGLKNDGIPIDGVGWELHNSIDPDGKILRCEYPIGSYTCTNVTYDLDKYLNNVDLNVKRYAKAGLKVAFTEVEGQIKYDDIDLTSPAGRAEYENRLQWQAKYFAGLLKIALDNDNVSMFHMWGGADRYQNVQDFSGYGNGFIFDKNFNPKPAYYAMLALLKTH